VRRYIATWFPVLLAFLEQSDAELKAYGRLEATGAAAARAGLDNAHWSSGIAEVGGHRSAPLAAPPKMGSVGPSVTVGGDLPSWNSQPGG
jgi:hypothetical protein